MYRSKEEEISFKKELAMMKPMFDIRKANPKYTENIKRIAKTPLTAIAHSYIGIIPFLQSGEEVSITSWAIFGTCGKSWPKIYKLRSR